MRVAMLGQYPLDEERILGGVEAVMVPLLRSLARLDDLDIHIVTCQPRQQNHTAVTARGLPLHILRRKRLGRITFHVRDVMAIRRVLAGLNPDIVHAQGLGIYASAAAGSGFAHVATAHGIFFREAELASGLAPRMRLAMDTAYEKYCLGRVKHLISISPYVEEELVRNRGFKGQVHRIENPVDDAFFVVDRPGEEGAILYAGRVIPRKGLLLLLQAMAKVHQEMPHVRLRVAGETDSDAAYVETCRRFMAEHDLAASITFLGSLSVQQMVEEYQRCAMLALPSRQETAPIVIAEAMAAARPVVATRVCGVPYMVVEGVTGVLVDYGDADALALALLHLLRDQELCRDMGRQGRELAQARFRGDVVAHQTRDLYQELAAR